MNHLSISKDKKNPHFPLVNPSLADRLEQLLTTKYTDLPDNMRKDIARNIEELKKSPFYEGRSKITTNLPR